MKDFLSLCNDIVSSNVTSKKDKNQIKRINKSKCLYMLMTFGISAIAFGCLILVVQPYHFFFKLKNVLSDGGEIFEIWRKPPADLYLKVYLFNVTNKDEFMSGKDSKLKFAEVGPYVYREGLEHSNVTFNENGTLSTIPLHPLEWVPEMSNGTEDDKLILPNIAHLSFANVMSERTYFTQIGVNLLIRQTGSQALEEQTAKEFMFGYKTQLVTLGNKFLPSWIMFDKLGLIDRMYDFKGDVETIYTGETDIKKTGLIASYNREEKLPQWEGPCGEIVGSSDGSKFPNYIKPNDTLRFYRKSLCRSVPLVRTSNETLVKNGLSGYEYTFIDNFLDNGEFIEENKCFCRKGKCLPRGLLDVGECYYGFPIALSMPHFYQGDQKLFEGIEGVVPDAKKHSTYFLVQPDSGLPLSLKVKMQINMALQDVSTIYGCKKFKNRVIPLLWTEIGMERLPQTLLNRFILYLNILPIFLDTVTYALFIGGVLFLAGSLYKFIKDTNKIAENEIIEFNFKSQNINDIYEKEKFQKDTKSSMISAEVLSEMIDEGKQAIFGKNKKTTTYAPRDGVYKETCRRRSSILNLFSLLSRGEKPQLKKQKTKEELYDVKVSRSSFLKLFRDNKKESKPLRVEEDESKQSVSTDSENENSIFESEVVPGETEELTATESRKTSETDEIFKFEVDVSLLDNIKEEIV